MNDSPDDIIARHRGHGLLIDTNCLLLYVIGAYDRSLISRFDRTEIFAEEDFDLLLMLIDAVPVLSTTAHVLTEVSNLLGFLREPIRTEVFLTTFSGIIQEMSEHQVPAEQLAVDRYFPAIGLTDTAILAISSELLVLTNDSILSNFLFSSGVDFLNINHLRTWLKPK